jgi:hypothetical protein
MRFSIKRVTVMRVFVSAAVLLLAGACVGCKDTPVWPEPETVSESGGHGSLTLKVVAAAIGRPASADEYETDFVVTVADTLGAPVTGAIVKITDRFGTVRLDEDNPVAGTYTAMRSGYIAGPYTLDVTHDADYVTGVTTHAPTIHDITQPAPHDTTTANTALNVRWTYPEAADESRLETRDFDSDWIFGDPGTLWTPTTGNPQRDDQRVRITRRNVQIAARGLPGSELSVQIQRTVEPIVAR